MNESEIIRLRGEGPPLVWPNGRDFFKQIGVASDIRLREHNKARGWTSRAPHDEAMRRCVDIFVRSQGWTPMRFANPTSRVFGKDFCLTNAARQGEGFRHMDCFRGGNHMVGAVIHVYNLQTALAALPAGGIVDALPLSWYFPKSPRYQLYTTAIVYRRMREATGARGIGARRAARATTTRG